MGWFKDLQVCLNSTASCKPAAELVVLLRPCGEDLRLVLLPGRSLPLKLKFKLYEIFFLMDL